MNKKIDIRKAADDRDFEVHQIKHAVLRDNWRLAVALTLLVGFTLLFGVEYATTVSCEDLSSAPNCVPDAERQWLRGLLNIMVGAVIGSALSSNQN